MPRTSPGISATSTPGSTIRSIESDVAQAEQDAAAFRERYHGTVAGLDAAALAEGVAEYERIESALIRPLTFAHLVFATNMADPARGALVARLGEKAATPRHAAPVLRPRVGGRRGRRCGGAARRPCARSLAASPAVAAEVPPLPPERARGADRHREDRVGLLGLVAALRGAARRDARDARRRGGWPSSRRWRCCSSRTVTCAAPPPRRSRRRSGPGSGRVRSCSTRSCRTSRSTTGCAATRPGSRRGTSRTRRRTRRSRR